VIDQAVAAIRAGKPVVLPTDTVYGLCASAESEEAVRALYRLKGRSAAQPTALLAGSVEALSACLPELDDRERVIVRALLPGPYTLVLANPARRYPRLTGTTPEAIGVRVPDLPEAAAAVVRELGVVVATSANLHGGRDPRRVEELDPELRAAVGAVVDAGALAGTPSTVISLTGPEPRVLREGAGPVAGALSTIRAWPRSSTASSS
jgi:L-threonylcarbamoyladenylate synthase